jgi:hypothetical protein
VAQEGWSGVRAKMCVCVCVCVCVCGYAPPHMLVWKNQLNLSLLPTFAFTEYHSLSLPLTCHTVSCPLLLRRSFSANASAFLFLT